MDIDEEIQKMIFVLRDTALREVLPRFRNITFNVKSKFKDFEEIVTEADIKAGKKILEKTRPKFPGSYSEEQLYKDRFDHNLIWQIDPVDGTSEFLDGMKEGYAMHAALLKREDSGEYFPISGIIYLPGADKLWYTDSDGKLHFLKNRREEKIFKQNRKELIGYIRKVDPNNKLKKFYSKLGKKLRIPAKCLVMGGSGASISNLLETKINLIIMMLNTVMIFTNKDDRPCFCLTDNLWERDLHTRRSVKNMIFVG